MFTDFRFGVRLWSAPERIDQIMLDKRLKSP
jgi:hypothetical protein